MLALTSVVALPNVSLRTLAGEPFSLSDLAGNALLIVNVASFCGMTPQYEGLQRLQNRYEDRGFSVLGFPCNQFGQQEPGTAEEIAVFCSTNYDVTFPLLEKVEVNGPGRHRLFDTLTAVPDASGSAGDIRWNFEKFLISRRGDVVARFRSRTVPESAEVVSAIETELSRSL